MKRMGGALLCIAAGGCLPYSPMDNPAPPVTVPDTFTSGSEQPERDARIPWWRDLNDAELDGLEQRALSKNLQLRAGFARLRQADALADQAGAPRWPQASLELSASRQRRRFGSLGALEFNSFSASIPVAYELDLFQRYGAQATAAHLDAQATRDDVEALAMTLSAELAERYYDVVEARARATLLAEQLQTNETFLELVTVRFRQGLASALDVYQQRQQVTGTRGQLALVEAKLAVSSNQLAVLLGEPPRGPVGNGGTDLPALPPPPALGVPSELLRNRPDLRSAKRRVMAADYRVGASIARWFPSIRLGATGGFDAESPTELLDQLVWSLFSSLSQSIFDGGERGAEVRHHKAVVEELLQRYGETMLTAMLEVENAIVLERQQHVYLERLAEQLQNGEDTLREARSRYREGLSDFLPVLTALTALQQVQSAHLTGRRQLVSYRIQLHRALGGTWTAQLPDAARQEQPEPDDAQEATP